MLLGIDVGGTHTDAVLLGTDGIRAACKVRTDHHNLLESIRAVLACVLKEVKPGEVKRLNLSTTLSTNAIIEGKTEEVGVLVSAGPGISPDNYIIGSCYHVVGGAIDHRGTELRPLDEAGLKEAILSCRKAGVRAFAGVTKFSTRNPSHEDRMQAAIAEHGQGCCDVVTMGHEISGRLNFPRRVATAYYNSAVWRLYNNFADMVEGSLPDLGPGVQVNVLKADGGTMPFALSRRYPVESILSGPAASVMGIVALCNVLEDSIILDIGGTTTDIAVFASGTPLIEHEGIAIGSYPTLVRALKTVSIGIGGDSALSVQAGNVRVGPYRHGPSLADGGTVPTLIDAFNFCGIIDYGDKQASIEGLRAFAEAQAMEPGELCDRAISYAAGRIKESVDELVREINDRPVYTIYELLSGKVIQPRKVYVMGGPAKAVSCVLQRTLGLPVAVPANYAIANAIGAALTKTTANVELFADTQKGVMFIPKLGIQKQVPRNYGIKDAENEARSTLLEFMRASGVPESEVVPEITESSSFNMIAEYYTIGRNIRVRCQAQPGIMRDYTRGIKDSC